MAKKNVLDLVFRLKAGCIAGESRMMTEAGLSPAEYNGIAAMNPGDRMSAGAVSRKMGLSLSRASRVIDKMVKNGYLLRENNADDRRKCTVSLANKGVDIKKKIEKLRSDCEKRIREQVSEKEIESLSSILERVIDVVKTA
jgi:DNA-binding MarR family transcriptional regulator